MADASKLADIAQQLRIGAVESTTAAGSGHPTSCASMAELTSVLFFDEMHIGAKDPSNANNDRFVLSKGHAAPILYAAWAKAGLFDCEHLKTLRKIDSDLEGHPTPALPFVDVATGSLGQGLGNACGMAWVGKYMDKAPYRVYCLLGDGECAEGSVWEAMNFAAHYKLDNLVAVIDVNRLGQSEPTMYQHDIHNYLKKVEATGCHAIAIDGHNIQAIQGAFKDARSVEGVPTVIIANTFKGKGLEGIEDKEGWHGRPLKADEAKTVIEHLRAKLQCTDCSVEPKGTYDFSLPCHGDNACSGLKPSYDKDQKVATRLAYGQALATLGGCCKNVVALDGDTKNSTFAIEFKKAFPSRFVECFIAEQNMVSVAVGASCRNRSIPFVSGFACFLSRAHDQIRMAAISKANVKFCGSHAGISIGEDGGSQMGMEDIAMFRCLPDSTVFYPSDAVSAFYSVVLAFQTEGICYIRTGRPNTPILYSNDEQFAVGKAKVIRQSDEDVCTIATAGVTLFEALKAADRLQSSGKRVRVLDLFTIKPIDCEALLHNAGQTQHKILTVEDHYPEGGIGEAVAAAVASCPKTQVHSLSVKRLPRSGKCDELLHMFGIDADAIVAKVQQM